MSIPLSELAGPMFKKVGVTNARQRASKIAMEQFGSLASGNSAASSRAESLIDPGSAPTATSREMQGILNETVGSMFGMPKAVEANGALNGKMLNKAVADKSSFLNSLQNGSVSDIKKNASIFSKSTTDFNDSESASMAAQAFNPPAPDNWHSSQHETHTNALKRSYHGNN